MIDSDKEYREKILAGIPTQTENDVWKHISPQDRNRIDCERYHLCGEDATWTAAQGNVHVCDYHRYILEIQRVLQRMESNCKEQAA